MKKNDLDSSNSERKEKEETKQQNYSDSWGSFLINRKFINFILVHF